MINIIGAGLAGCECAFYLASAGYPVTLYEMKPGNFSPAHKSPNLAELVCSNSLRSDDPTSAIGLLKEEMRALGSLTLNAAETARVPAGKALAVDRALFSSLITARIQSLPKITLRREEITSLEPFLASPEKTVLSAGPLASPALSASLAELTGEEHLYFYDAIAPVVSAESLDYSIIFQASRYDGGQEGDYLNCPMNREEYLVLREALLQGEKAQTHALEKEIHFAGCMPIEALAERGEMTLAFGPFKPVGFTDPRTGRRPFALVQLRTENLNRNAYNLVGCQTKLTYPEQQRIFRLIPGLQQAEFLRYGSMHRNTFVNAPKTLCQGLALRAAPQIHLAGQITGVEGYVESAACGLWLGILLTAELKGKKLPPPPPESALGALLMHLRVPSKDFQPSNAQFGLMPELGAKAGKQSRRALYAERGRAAFTAWRQETGFF